MDGGTVWNTNLVSAILRCKEIVLNESDITIDIIVLDANELSPWYANSLSITNWMRFSELQSYNDELADIQEFVMAYPDINFRYLLYPSSPLPGGLEMLNFDNSTSTWPMQLLGRKDGADIIK